MKFEASGVLDAGYSFERVPLKLANTLAPARLPASCKARCRATAAYAGTDGQWIGDLAVTSESARLVMATGEELPAAAALANQGTLLIYENLDMQADFRGHEGQREADGEARARGQCERHD
jgi:hypothetical protein